MATWTADVGPLTLERVVDICEQIALRGRGGAAFPLSAKLRAVSEAADARGVTPVIIANGDEGEPSSVKDRYLLRDRPHLVLDGVGIAARALGAKRAIIYVSDASLVDGLREAAAPWMKWVRIEMVVCPLRYVSGEETAAVRMINEGISKPTAKPPRPYEHGVDGLPTLVSNVETLAHLARGVRLGSKQIVGVGTPEDVGVTLITLVPDRGSPSLVEVPFGTPLLDVLRRGQIVDGDQLPTAVLTGGFFGGFLPRDAWNLPVGHMSMREAGYSLGCGSFLVLTDACSVGVGREILKYFARENAQQCGVCMNGTQAMADSMTRISRRDALRDDRANLERWATTLPGRGDCALLDAACRIVSTLIEHGEGVLDQHLSQTCLACSDDRKTNPRTRFEVRLPTPTEESSEDSRRRR